MLQDLQKKYVRLEMALQYSFFDNQPNKRTIMVTPIQETPSLTLSESDMQVANEPDENIQNGHFEDPLRSRWLVFTDVAKKKVFRKMEKLGGPKIFFVV